MKKTSCKRGFALIELLVVVLIIAILAAVAVPQYQKTVWKSRNTEMKQIVKAVADAEQVYYLSNGKYAANFNELDIDLPLTPIETTVGGGTGRCSTTVQGTDSSRQGKDYYVTLNSTDAEMGHVGIVAYWETGTYACAGFGKILGNSEPALEDLHCREMKYSFYEAGQDNFCKKLEQGTQLDVTSSAWRFYSLP